MSLTAIIIAVVFATAFGSVAGLGFVAVLVDLWTREQDWEQPRVVVHDRRRPADDMTATGGPLVAMKTNAFCRDCGGAKRIHARGFCAACYSRRHRNGELRPRPKRRR